MKYSSRRVGVGTFAPARGSLMSLMALMINGVHSPLRSKYPPSHCAIAAACRAMLITVGTGKHLCISCLGTSARALRSIILRHTWIHLVHIRY
ncbi:hypothetical protein NEOLEDRAFT_204263 [Neolentinus lepideus HHB14362 ss-1]|uniref:Uncharacterized protein n=1 Tax=Neolentinus lepideus HHB14362 ss-1 TaxID=1314782 RepID=A0A165TIU3_9AGAM|nr:hypothetical protein NEOLEDRAFT_204263 [Neolentinus lepideus HHB14362 ss-1]